jgi:hypothetical protein
MEQIDAANARGEPKINARVFVGSFSAAEAAATQLAVLRVPGRGRVSAADDGWDHAALPHMRQLSAAAVHVVVFAICHGMLVGSKKKFEAGIAARMRLAPGETGGRYRCVAPEKLLVPGFTTLMTEEHMATLERDRLVVVDNGAHATRPRLTSSSAHHSVTKPTTRVTAAAPPPLHATAVLPAHILEAARSEALAMAKSGFLKGERSSTCNPGEASAELPCVHADCQHNLFHPSTHLNMLRHAATRLKTAHTRRSVRSQLARPMGPRPCDVAGCGTGASSPSLRRSGRGCTIACARYGTCQRRSARGLGCRRACRRPSYSPRTQREPSTTATSIRTTARSARTLPP